MSSFAFVFSWRARVLMLSLFMVLVSGCQAGESRDELERGSAPILYGSPDYSSQHRAVVYLDIEPSNEDCTGVLIDREMVLTAGHCLEGASSVDVYFGDVLSSMWAVRSASVAYIDEDYDPTSGENNIGLLRLSSPAPSAISPIPPLPSSLALSDADEDLLVMDFVGFGEDQHGNVSVKRSVSLVLNHQCGASACSIPDAPGQIPPRTFQVEQELGGVCGLDIGGPALIRRAGEEYVAGVAIFTDQSCTDYGVSVRVDAFEGFLQEAMGGEDCGNGVDDDGDGDVDCDDDTCDAHESCQSDTCEHPRSLSCGESHVFDTRLADGFYEQYSCISQFEEEGPEKAYFLDVPVGTHISVDLDLSGSTDLDLLILKDYCDPQYCSGGSAEQAGVDEHVEMVVSGDTFAMVETFGAAGSYTLSLTCSENCTNGVDDDGDGEEDCADEDCQSAQACLEDCENNIDDDGDGDVDCDDSTCAMHRACVEGEVSCFNMRDDDGDGLVDCADEDCADQPLCIEEICDNDFDDDQDGKRDCFDPECFGAPICGDTELCDNGYDDDLDGLVDCDDEDCGQVEICGLPEDCTNGMDDNEDGLVDCGDPLCEEALRCQPEDCENGVDDDADGSTDCSDYECRLYLRCQPEDCGNGIDDDADGDFDCADEECVGVLSCVAENCTNGLDDDLDGWIDCADYECKDHVLCPGTPENCGNAHDDDDDGLIDCNDSECLESPHCKPEKICDDEVDDDFDGYVDCQDVDCADAENCAQVEQCESGLDEDGDGAVDCSDSDCLFSPVCAENPQEICGNGLDDDGNGRIDCGDLACICEAAGSESSCSMTTPREAQRPLALLLMAALLFFGLRRR